jgi:predicted DNA-binding transcriptional regulator AlpA
MADNKILTDIADIFERLSALETAVFVRTGNPRPVSVGDRKLTKKQVGLREGKSPRSIDRAVKEKQFPQPDVIDHGRCYWWESTLERHDRERLREARKVWPVAKGQSDAAKA